MVYRATDCHSERSEESRTLRALRCLVEFARRHQTPIPPDGDPTQPLYLAVQSARALTFVSFGIATILAFAILLESPFGGFPDLVVFLVVCVFILASGIVYFVFAGYLRDHCMWAATGLLVLASVHGLLGLFPMGAVLLGQLRADLAAASLVQGLSWITLFARFIYYISRSYAAIRFKLGVEPRGFEVVMPADKPVPDKPLPAEALEKPFDSAEFSSSEP
jgi:hypothetical protein